MKRARWIQGSSCILAALAVMLGAFGAHGLEGRLTEEALEWYHTGVQYHFGHAIALWFAGDAVRTGRKGEVAALFFWIGIFFFALMVLFSLLTIPVEFNASSRGLKLLEEAGLMHTEEDRKGSKAVLNAAGMTYVAAAVTSILQLLYYISVAKRRG